MIAFLLNLEAEKELAGENVDLFRAIEQRPELLERLSSLLADARVVTRQDIAAKSLKGMTGRAWCPTPRALALLQDGAAELPAAPSLEVLQTVNSRAFSVALDRSLGHDWGACFATSIDGARAHLERASDTGSYLLKRPFGFAGKGRLVTSGWDSRTEHFVRSSIRTQGGVAIEPLFERTIDTAIHGFITAEGERTIGAPLVTTVSNGGVFAGARKATADDLCTSDFESLKNEANAVALALHSAGYFGPFGIDGFRYRTASSEAASSEGLIARCEINARYSMAWATGMGGS